MTERGEDSTRAPEPRLSVVAAPLVQEQEKEGRGQEKRAQGLEPGVAGEEAGERGQRTGTEGRRRDLEADGVCGVALADPCRRLGDQQREDRSEQEAEGEEAREGARAASRQAHDEGGQGRAGHAEAKESRRGSVVSDRTEGQATHEDAAQ